MQPHLTHKLAEAHIGAGTNRVFARDMAVSSRSFWGDDVWIFDNLTPGRGPVAASLRWDFAVGDIRSTDVSLAPLMQALRVFAWSLLSDKRTSIPLKVASVAALGAPIKDLVRWMHGNSYRRLDELDGAASHDFLKDLPRILVTRTGDGGISMMQALARTRLWTLLWEQRDALRGVGISPLPEVPFSGTTAKAAADRVATRTSTAIPPFPDEVALPILAAASRMTAEPADDVVRLLRFYISVRDGREKPEDVSLAGATYAKTIARRAVLSFRFSSLPGESEPWRQPWGHMPADRQADGSIDWVQTAMDAVRDAAVALIQGTTGMRINEICGLKAGEDPATGLPTAIDKRTSPSGLFEMFFLRGVLAKTAHVPEPTEWLIGARPVGSTHVPPAVRAVQVLHRLFEPFRETAASPAIRRCLIVNAPGGILRSRKRSGTIRPITTAALLAGLKDFVANWVDLSRLPERSRRGEDLRPYRDSAGRCVRTHQWRKTFALYVFRTDNRMIPAIAQQFKHLNLAMTEASYIGNDPELVATIEDTILDETTDFFFKATFGRERMFGRFAEIIERNKAELAALGRSSPTPRDGIRRWVIENDIRLFFGRHGKCIIGTAPLAARCHQAAGTTHWNNRRPNLEARDTGTCLGCSCFAIDGEHVEYWQERLTRNLDAWQKAKGTPHERDFRVARDRATQSATVLQHLGIVAPEVITHG